MAPSRQCKEPQWGNRIIAEFSMPVQDAFDGLPSRTWAGAVLGCFAGALIRVLPFSLTGCNERCLTTPALGLGLSPSLAASE